MSIIKKDFVIQCFNMFRNKFLQLCISIFLLMIFSCSNDKNSLIVTKTDNSLRNKMAYLDNDIVWTENLDNILVETQENAEEDYENSEEFQRLLPHQQMEYRRKKEEELKKNKRVVPDGLSEINFTERLFYPKNEPPAKNLFPDFNDFGSIDISLLAPEAKVIIEKFIEGQNQDKLEIDCISPDTRFLEPIFLQDFSLIENVDSFIIGKPIIIQNEFLNEYQVPVRMITENGFYNTLFFLVNQQDKFFIEQVNYGSLICE